MMMQILRDARLGLRLLWRQPSFTTVALLALALGVAANTAIFSIVHATLLAPLPYDNPDELVIVWSRIQNNRNSTAAGDYLDWVRLSRSFQGLHAWSGGSVSLSSSGQSDQVTARRGTPGFLTTHGFKLFMGRDFLPDEGTVGKDQVVVMTHEFWRTRFAADPSILGRQIRVDGKPHAVVGVLAPGVPDRLESKLFLPLAFTPEQLNHDFHWLLVLGRLKPGVTLAQANADMVAVTKRIAEDHPSSNTGWSASVEPLKNNFLDANLISTLWLLLGAVGFVLLIACTNVANLLLARGTVRHAKSPCRARCLPLQTVAAVPHRERRARHGRWRARPGLSFLLMNGIMAVLPPNTLPSEADVRINLPGTGVHARVSMLSGILFGCAPAWQVSRLVLNDVLKEAGRSAVGGGRLWMRRALVVVEFALALTLLAGAGLAIASVTKLMTVNLGFQTDNLLTFTVPVPAERLKESDQITAFYRQLLEKIAAIPGVQSASVSTGMPVNGTNFGMPFSIVGRPVTDPSQRPGAGFNMVTPEYFRTFGIAMQRGRSFTDQDSAGAERVAIVNDAFARTYMNGLDPLTQRIVIEQLIPGVTRLGAGVEWRIVGVYRAVRNGGPRGDFPEIDVPFAQSPWPGTTVAVRTRRASRHAASEPGGERAGARSGPRDHRHDDHGADGVHDIAGARRPPHGGPVRRLRGSGARARGPRHLRRHVVCRGSADARDRSAHGARRRTRSGAAPAITPRRHHDIARRRASAGPRARIDCIGARHGGGCPSAEIRHRSGTRIVSTQDVPRAASKRRPATGDGRTALPVRREVRVG